MVAVDKAIVARLKTHGLVFEIMVDCEKALQFKAGRLQDINEALAVRHIYSDADKGLEASEISLKSVFKTADPLEVAKQIIQKGEIQLTTEYRQKLREQKRRQVIDILHKNGVDPRTHLPHPITRLENALEEAKVHVDEFSDVHDQVQDILKKLKPILPIKFEMKEIALKIPAQHAPKVYGPLKSFGAILNDEWQKDGSWVVVIEVPGGLEQDLYDRLNGITHGDMEAKVMKVK
ncbi:ribosome assembly factor SBDS [Candidatus Woesearchaeota archaeon]|nr:ribosome assembly factor SBDS [Candidatus Woesearchaeota archaeon]